MEGAPVPDRQPKRPRLRLAVVAGALVAVGVTVAAMTVTDSQPPASRKSLPAGEFPEPGIEQTHGLGIDPADGVLIAAGRVHVGRMHMAGLS